jgi:hypothetical protein
MDLELFAVNRLSKALQPSTGAPVTAPGNGIQSSVRLV